MPFEFDQLPTTVRQFDRFLIHRVRTARADVNQELISKCCMCQQHETRNLEAYHPLGSLLPFCSRECRGNAQKIAKALEDIQIIYGVRYDNVQ